MWINIWWKAIQLNVKQPEWPKKNVNTFFGVVSINDELNAVFFHRLIYYFFSIEDVFQFTRKESVKARWHWKKKILQMTLWIINKKYLDIVNDLNDQQSECERKREREGEITHILTSQSIHRSHLWWQASFWRENVKTWYIKIHLKSTQFIIGSKTKVNVNNIYNERWTMNIRSVRKLKNDPISQ